MTRIRYAESGMGCLVSQQSFVAGPNLVKVLIETFENHFGIEVRKLGNNSQLDELLIRTTAMNLTVAKKAAKALLIGQGVQFDLEVRNRGVSVENLG